MTAGIYIPSKTPQRTQIPATPALAEMIGDYKGRETVAQGEVFDVSPTNIETRTNRSVLPSGIKVALLPKKTRGGTVDLSLTLRYGNGRIAKQQSVVVTMMPELMMREQRTCRTRTHS